MTEPTDTPTRPDDIEPDPRTDGVGYEGHGKLGPPSTEEIAAGVDFDRATTGPTR